MGYSFWLTARILLYASSHRQDNTYHSLYYTSHGAMAQIRNSSMGPPWRIDLITHRTMIEHSYHGATSCSWDFGISSSKTGRFWILGRGLGGLLQHLWYYETHRKPSKLLASDLNSFHLCQNICWQVASATEFHSKIVKSSVLHNSHEQQYTQKLLQFSGYHKYPSMCIRIRR